MATSVEELLNMLFDMVDEARNAPLSSEKCVIERDKALDLIEDAKAQLPVELAEARKVLNNRNELLSSAKREAEELQKRAENEARRLVSETEVMAVARQKASEMMAQADQKSKEMRTVANQYCEDVMRRASHCAVQTPGGIGLPVLPGCGCQGESDLVPHGGVEQAPRAGGQPDHRAGSLHGCLLCLGSTLRAGQAVALSGALLFEGLRQD